MRITLPLLERSSALLGRVEAAELATMQKRAARAAVPQTIVYRDVGLHIVYNWGMPSGDTTTVRVRRPDSERLQSIAKDRHTTVIEVLHSAIDALERQEFLRGLSEDYQRLREDPKRWKEHVDERREWDALA